MSFFSELNLSANRISSLPQEMVNCSQLQQLDISTNRYQEGRGKEKKKGGEMEEEEGEEKKKEGKRNERAEGKFEN